MATILAPNGKLIASMIDPLATSDPAHLAYHARNRAAGRPPGLARMQGLRVIEWRFNNSDPLEAGFRLAAA
jgi:hypothetical protein